jgi:hypothetical protein
VVEQLFLEVEDEHFCLSIAAVLADSPLRVSPVRPTLLSAVPVARSDKLQPNVTLRYLENQAFLQGTGVASNICPRRN